MIITAKAMHKSGWKFRELNNSTMLEGWKYLSKKQEELVDAGERHPFNCARIIVRFGEYVNVLRPIVYLSVGQSSLPLFHIDTMAKLNALYIMLYQDEIDAMKFVKENEVK